ncbi:dihydrolipoamide dehydrogenase [Thermosyntropha lipolytica DSM 11003]|uniref:Dihydrolipoyl dehydrogenase n=1 Tax=Thermosyntropha lipolytica DSM 11003 TaxID=1123382 RepID=A0A1M5MTJ8_9FIRM|nr:dihydrolipoyl dehydrogenase [Thermosyntropha lipolytica]SHG80628.1 dihydrolipoamide dehydrogenase [Thermosyntropha lipolytica DSM 11003]
MRDLVIIGGGPGGYVAAIRASQLGMKTVLIEKDEVGGTCLNRGCIPTKAYFQNAKAIHTIKRAEEFNIEVSGFKFSLEKAKARKDSIVNQLVSGVKQLLKANGVELIKGEAALIAPDTVAVNGEEIKARNILIATGSVPARLQVEGADLPEVITSDEALELTEVPSRLAVIGGGVIGLEFACIFSHFGSKVTVIEYMPNILGSLDKEISKRMGVFLKKQNIDVHTGAAVTKIEKKDGEVLVHVEGKKEAFTVASDLVLMSTGRRPCIKGLNLDKVGIETEKDFIKVDENYQTSVKGVYAIGDVIGGQMLAHKASEEGIVAVEKMAGLNSCVHYHAVPGCIFTFPEIATVGMSEEEAQAKGITYKVGKFQFAANGKAMTMGEAEGLVKILADQNDIIIGVHIIGPHASDLILEGTMMVKNRMRIKDVIGTIHPHPTLGEAIMEAVLDVHGEAIHLAPRKK